MKFFRFQALIISLAILGYTFSMTTNSLAENKRLQFSTHVAKDTIVFKRTYAIMEEAFARIGYDFLLNTYPGKRALQLSNSGRTDGEAHRIYDITSHGAYPNLIRIPECQQIIHDYAYATKDIDISNGWPDLASYNVAIRRGAAFLTKMSQKHALTTYELDTTEQLVKYLQTGRADIILSNPDEAHLVLGSEEIKDSTIRRLEPPLSTLPIFTYLHKRHANLVPRVAATLHEMKLDGTYQRKFDKYSLNTGKAVQQ
jgi:polar amino acid transport system substrate-binding protein